MGKPSSHAAKTTWVNTLRARQDYKSFSRFWALASLGKMEDFFRVEYTHLEFFTKLFRSRPIFFRGRPTFYGSLQRKDAKVSPQPGGQGN